MRTITRLFDHHTDALDAVRGLEKDGRVHDISLVCNTEQWHTAGQTTETRRDKGDDNNAGEGAATGAGVGAALGGGAGLLAGLGMLAIPGVGPVVAAGWLAATAAGAVGGAVAGGAAGGLIDALTTDGESEEDVHVYAEGVRRGGSLVSVRAEDDQVDDVVRILEHHGGVVARTRGQAYREQGWERFDPKAEPYDRDRVMAERGRYRPPSVTGETRSFGAVDPQDDSIPADRSRSVQPATTGATPPRI